MKKIIIVLLVLLTHRVFAGWVNMNTGINDKLTGVVFQGNNGVITGHKGVYYTTTGGNGPASWTRLNVTGADGVIYNNTQFSDVSSKLTSSLYPFYVCGTDTVNGKAVIMRIDLATMACVVIYVGQTGSSLNSIAEGSFSYYYAVGNNGLMIWISSYTAEVMNTPFTDNLRSISLSGSYFSIPTNNKIICGTVNVATFTYTITPTPTHDFVSSICNGQNYGYAVGSGYGRFILNGIQEYTKYDFGSLNARCINADGTYNFIGTDHGIFRGPYGGGGGSYLEWQPTAYNYTINDIWCGSIIYACGENGLLLSTTDQGGLPRPYTSLSNFTGGCAPSVIYLGGWTIGSATSCQQYLNGALLPSSCGSIVSYTISTPGQYTLQVNTSNGPGSYDTTIKVVTFSSPPLINKPVSLNKNILCHKEPVIITISNSEPNVAYTLKKFGNSVNYGTSAAGNGSAIVFTSDSLSEAGSYYLSAQPVTNNCIRNFTDTIHIDVEKTKADFHLTKINITPNEPLSAYAACTDAQHYSWSFSPNATPTSSTFSNPDFSFGVVSSVQTKLICWSDNGCYDSIVKNEPTIYSDPAIEDSCWTIVNDGTDPVWWGQYTEDISEINPSKNGFLVIGHYNNPEVFSSRYGRDVTPKFKNGGYLLKNDNNGVIKWMVYTRQINQDPQPDRRDQIYSVKEDSIGNIYIAGVSSGTFYDNAGDSILISNTGYNAGYLIKLDSLGKLVWKLTCGDWFVPQNISIDKAGNVIMLIYTNGATTNTPILLNDVQIYTVGLTLSPTCNFSLLKVNPLGFIQWDANAYLYLNNNVGLRKTEIDAQNNIYLTGTYESQMRLYSAGSSTYTTLSPLINGASNNISKAFLAKYNSNGIIQWAIRGLRIEGVSMTTDAAGDCYISGSGFHPLFEDTDGIADSASVGDYYISKINSNGVCQWIQGADSYYGYGHQVIKSGNEISVLGEISNNSSTTQTSVFTSSNNDNIVLALNEGDYFIAVYDTSGNLLRIRVNGNNPNETVNTVGFAGLFKKGSAYYFARNFWFYNGATIYDNFGTLMGPPNGTDGSITKVSGDCGITLLPGYGTGIVGSTKGNTSFKIYPNPNSGKFVVESIDKNKGSYDIEIYNGLSQLVYKETIIDKTEVDLTELSMGIYIILIKFDGKQFSRKISID